MQIKRIKSWKLNFDKDPYEFMERFDYISCDQTNLVKRANELIE